MNKKIVVLVFDDLERSKLDTIDVLGCINDYSENKKIHTIVVANEDKILSNRKKEEKDIEENSSSKNQQINIKVGGLREYQASEICYDEIKEKIIERTIKYKPDYDEIVHAVIEKQKFPCEQYHNFLVQYEQNILWLFDVESAEIPDNYKNFTQYEKLINQPHNIRSLKCALQDFYRIYRHLVNNKISDLEKWLYSFVSYVFAYKAGVAKQSEHSISFTNKEVTENCI